MPGLEIMADNVKCSHGATSGQIDADELFYLLARGIPKMSRNISSSPVSSTKSSSDSIIPRLLTICIG